MLIIIIIIICMQTYVSHDIPFFCDDILRQKAGLPFSYTWIPEIRYTTIAKMHEGN